MFRTGGVDILGSQTVSLAAIHHLGVISLQEIEEFTRGGGLW